MASKIATAYVQIVPSAEGITGSLQGVLSPEAKSAGLQAGAEAGEGLGSALKQTVGAEAEAAGGEAGGKLGSKLLSVASGAIKNGAAILGKASAVAFGAATAATGALAKSAVESYAQYEQLVGGVDKLYKDASGQIQKYADQAYATAGMSANQYMETATSFSASLINSLGGDTKKAAELTDVAMRAMSDNVNVFGSNMGDVEHAFQGFAKQNYTMLDNLKLGYGGTKEEMQRLIDDANAYRKSIGETSDLSINSFGDVVQAIQSVQEAQGIAGTTAREAMTTIEGASTATKAAWENVVTAIGRGEGIGDAMKGLATSIFGEKEGEGLLNQVLPRIQTVFEGIGAFVEQAAPFITDHLPGLISSVIPGLLDASASMFVSLASSLPGLASGLMETARSVALNIGSVSMEAVTSYLASDGLSGFLDAGIEMIVSLADGFLSGIPALLEGAGEMLSQLVAWIMSDGLPMLAESAVSLIGGLVQVLWDNLPSILSAAGDMLLSVGQSFLDNAPNLAGGLSEAFHLAGDMAIEAFKGIDWLAVGRDVIGFIASAASGAGQLIISALSSIGQTALIAFRTIDWAGVGRTVIGFIGSAAGGAIGLVTTALRNIGSRALETFRSIDWRGVGRTVISFIASAAGGAIGLVTTALRTIGSNALRTFRSIDWRGVGRTVITYIGTAASNAGSAVINALRSIGSRAMDAFKNINWRSVGSAVINGIKSGITNAAEGLASAARNAASNALSRVKGFLGIHSPSSVFRDEVGKMIGLGWAQGIADTAGKLAESAGSASRGAMRAAQDAFDGLNLDNDVTISARLRTGDDLQRMSVPSGRLAEPSERATAADAVLNLLLQYLPIIAQRGDVYLDTDRLVGALAGPMDKELGYRLSISRG